MLQRIFTKSTSGITFSIHCVSTALENLYKNKVIKICNNEL